jgi:hypothetical protein|tara:strand:- start:115 stop:216 length:102 start_codon:yes stop_codon:yes gene_type:complete
MHESKNLIFKKIYTSIIELLMEGKEATLAFATD